MDTAAVRLEGIGKRYRTPWQWLSRRNRTAVEALTDVSLTIPHGEVCGLLGVNGAGKTTLIKVIATLVLPDQGRGWVDGIDLLREPLAVRARIGHVTTNDRSFYWRLSVRENLDFFAALCGLHGAPRARRISDLLHLTGLDDCADQRFMTLSAGQRQRAAIARALLANPPILLLDEPTSGLDPLVARQLRSFIAETLVRSQGKTVLWCTHNLYEAQQVCDRVLMLHHGKIVAMWDRETLRRRVDEDALWELCLAGSSTALVEDLVDPLERRCADGLCTLTFRADASAMPSILRQLVARGGEIVHCERKELALEQRFTRVVEEERS